MAAIKRAFDREVCVALSSQIEFNRLAGKLWLGREIADRTGEVKLHSGESPFPVELQVINQERRCRANTWHAEVFPNSRSLLEIKFCIRERFPKTEIPVNDVSRLVDLGLRQQELIQ